MALLQPGNIDLSNRPVVRNADGSISTVRSMSVGMDGQEFLIPTVSDDGRVLTEDQAISMFRRTGKHLGAFDTPQAATQYAERLHRDQERQYVPSRASRPWERYAAQPAAAEESGPWSKYAATEEPAAPEVQGPGLMDRAVDTVTGGLRRTPETDALPDWAGMPEMNSASVASFKAALGTLLSNPTETSQVIQANFPGVQVRQDDRGNYI